MAIADKSAEDLWPSGRSEMLAVLDVDLDDLPHYEQLEVQEFEDDLGLVRAIDLGLAPGQYVILFKHVEVPQAWTYVRVDERSIDMPTLLKVLSVLRLEIPAVSWMHPSLQEQMHEVESAGSIARP